MIIKNLRNKTNSMIMPTCSFKMKNIKIHIMGITEDKFKWMMIRNNMEVDNKLLHLIRMLNLIRWIFKYKTTALQNRKFLQNFKIFGITKTKKKIKIIVIQALSVHQLHHMTMTIRIHIVNTRKVAFKMMIFNNNMT